MNHLLSWIIWLPVLGMVTIAFVPRDKSELIKQIAAVVSGIQLVLAIYLWRIFDATNGTFQFMERAEWIPSFNITYILGVVLRVESLSIYGTFGVSLGFTGLLFLVLPELLLRFRYQHCLSPHLKSSVHTTPSRVP